MCNVEAYFPKMGNQRIYLMKPLYSFFIYCYFAGVKAIEKFDELIRKYCKISSSLLKKLHFKKELRSKKQKTANKFNKTNFCGTMKNSLPKFLVSYLKQVVVLRFLNYYLDNVLNMLESTLFQKSSHFTLQKLELYA